MHTDWQYLVTRAVDQPYTIVGSTTINYLFGHRIFSLKRSTVPIVSSGSSVMMPSCKRFGQR